MLLHAHLSFLSLCFPMIRKLDAAFRHLLHRHNTTSMVIDDQPPYHVSTADRVRIKSLVEDTRVVAVEAAVHTGHQTQMQDLPQSGEKEMQTKSQTDNEKNRHCQMTQSPMVSLKSATRPWKCWATVWCRSSLAGMYRASAFLALRHTRPE